MILLLLGISFWCCDSVIAESCMTDYVDELLVENAELRSVYHHWQAALAKVGYSNALPDPRVSYGYFVKEVETRVGPQKQRLGISQKIPWPGKLKYRKDAAAKEALVAEEQMHAHQIRLVHQLRELFFHFHYLKKITAITVENERLLTLIERITESQVRVGGSMADVLQAQMEVSTLQDHSESLRERTFVVIARINALLNRSVNCALEVPSDLFDYLSVPERLCDADLVTKNPELRIITAKIARQQDLKHLAHQNYYPDITVGVDWIQTDHALMSTPESGKDPVVAMISLNIPLWHGDYRSRENEATYRVCAAEQQLEQKKYLLQAELEDIVLKYKEADREVLLFQEVLIPKAKQTLEILQDAYVYVFFLTNNTSLWER